MEQVATHIGKVSAVKQNNVSVLIESVSACAACQAHSKCGFSESKEKELHIDTDQWALYSVGDTVEVQITQGLGMMAVLWAYFLPAVLLIASLLLSLRFLHSEGLSIVVSLAVLLLYYLVLYANRKKLQRRFNFQIRHVE